MPMVYLPVDRSAARALRDGVELTDRRGCCGTAGLARSLQTTPGSEELDFVALGNASVLALLMTTDPLRLVLAVEVGDAEVTELAGDLGEVRIARVPWGQVQALFADEPAAAGLVAGARTAVGDDLDEALVDDAVAALLGGFDLLWYAPEELDQI